MRHLSRFILLSAAGLLIAAQACAQPLAVEGDTELSASQFREFVELALPKQELDALRAEPARFGNLVRDYFMLQRLADEARAEGLDDAAFRLRMELQQTRTLANQMLQKKLAAEPEPSFEKAARETYLANKSSFQAPPEVHAQHILIAVSDERDESAALTRALEVHALVLAQPERFGELAAEYSDDPGSAGKQGDLGFFAADRMVKPFADAAFALKEGAISEPVLSRFGYHVIRTLKHRESRQLKFEEVREQLINREQKAYKARQREQLVQQLQDAAEYDREAIEALYGELFRTGK